jgi:crotonobetainyl-CoA:carnitine CoA-transferase CaiB-like acyl-CoA transferase
MSGFMSTTGKENSLPIRVSFALFDVYTGMMVFIYVLAALYANAKPKDRGSAPRCSNILNVLHSNVLSTHR